MAAVVYLLCAFTSLCCGFLLARGFRKTRLRLLFWSAGCFLLLGLSSALLFLDLIVFPDGDLLTLRHSTTLLALGLQLYGLIFESD